MSSSTIEKAFLLLEYLVSRGEPVPLQDITAAAGLPKPTACRLLHQLESLGYVTRAPGSRDYLVGTRTEKLSGKEVYADLKAAARPILRRLHGKLNETINLGVLDGSQVLYIDYIETTQPLRYILIPGENDPFDQTALGRAIAARLSSKELDALLAPLPHAAALRETLAKTRQHGYAEERGEAAEGVACLAIDLAPLGHPGAAISVSVPLQRYDDAHRQSIIDALGQCLQTPPTE